jgi:hypothetical protein
MMWQYLGDITKTLQQVTEFGKKDPVTTKLLLKRPPAKRYGEMECILNSVFCISLCRQTLEPGFE